MSAYIGNLKNAQIIESQWIANLTAKINAVSELVNEVNPCALLQEIVDEVFAYIQARVAALEAQIEALAIVELLLELPSDLDAALKWIENCITAVIQPLYQTYLTAIAQLAAIAQAIIGLTTAITNAAARIGSCVPNIPSITVNVPTPFPAPT